jgi:hypothetical protein
MMYSVLQVSLCNLIAVRHVVCCFTAGGSGSGGTSQRTRSADAINEEASIKSSAASTKANTATSTAATTTTADATGAPASGTVAAASRTRSGSTSNDRSSGSGSSTAAAAAVRTPAVSAAAAAKAAKATQPHQQQKQQQPQQQQPNSELAMRQKRQALEAQRATTVALLNTIEECTAPAGAKLYWKQCLHAWATSQHYEPVDISESSNIDTAVSVLEQQLQSLEQLRSAVAAAAVSSDAKDLLLAGLLNYGMAHVQGSRSDKQMPPLTLSEQRAVGEAVLSVQLRIVDYVNSLRPGSVRKSMQEKLKRCLLHGYSVELNATTAAASAAAAAAAAAAESLQCWPAEFAMQGQLQQIVQDSQVAELIKDLWIVRLLEVKA